MPSKLNHRLYDINVRGSASAMQAADDVILAVIEALQNQYPKLSIVGTRHELTNEEKPFLMIPTNATKGKK